MRESVADLGRKLVAVVVLIFALALALKFIVGVVAGFVHLIFIVLVTVVVLFAVVWALRVL